MLTGPWRPLAACSLYPTFLSTHKFSSDYNRPAREATRVRRSPCIHPPSIALSCQLWP